MKLTSSQKIGIFVVAIVILLFFVLNFLKGSDLFGKRNRYYTYLSDVESLTATSPIYIRGLKVGTIEEITFDPVRDSFLLKMSVKRDYVLPLDSRVEVYSSDLLGGKSLRLALGNADLHAHDGDTLKGKNVPDMMSLLYSYLGPLKEKVYSVLDKLDTSLTAINMTLDSAAIKDVHESLSLLSETLSNTRTLTAEIGDMTPELHGAIGNINSLSSKLDSPDGEFQQALGNINKTVTELSDLKLNETVEELNNLLRMLQDTTSTAGKLIGTGELHDSLDSLVYNLNNLVKKIEANPKKFLKVSVF